MRRPTRPAVVALLCVLLLTTGCTSQGTSEPPKNLPAADSVVTQLVAGLQKGDVRSVPMTTDAAVADTELTLLMSGMDGLLPTVTAGQVSYSDEQASVPLEQSMALGSGTWTWTTTANLRHVDGAWKVEWAPAIVESDLDGTTRLRHTREAPRRASILGANGKALVEVRTAYRVGVDKANLAQAKWESTARGVAKAVGVDANAYVKKVLAAGAKAFVSAITLRQGAVPAAATSAGGRVQEVEMPLAPSSTFALGVLGTSGQPTTEQLTAAKGDLAAEDYVGTSGLQQRYEAQLRGTPGHTVDVVVRSTGTQATATPAGASASPSGAGDASPSTTAAPGSTVKTVYQSAAKPGTDLQTSLDLTLQTKAERALAKAAGIASMAVVDVKTGALVAAANSSAAGANPYATYGRFAPGSTFKVVTSLALLRKGLTPESTVPCTTTVTVDGRTFKNYADFPSSATGNVPLRTALAKSCNTAFISQWAKLGTGDLASAAASLGLGVDQDAGYPSFFGSVPASTAKTTRAANMIGQGEVEASPMAMAGVAASVARGTTTIPWLVSTKKPTATAKLTAEEGKQLRSLMHSVVTDGSGRVLSGLVTGAKTGTAEFGTASPPKTHAWMIAWNDSYAIAVMVNEGESGSKTAAPLVKAFLES
ncbi:penicillin-binding transpeptidase domain-containing protein [Luteococcus sanguinis]|uniref:Beta-lactamase n=1 Tax=Luteococcus sanguinis TaxID=174038 RepID=A0ABW1X805_9ACTN